MQWVKACGAVANFILVNGHRGVALVQKFEGDMCARELTPGTFRVMEGLHVPEDFQEVCTTLELQKKLSPGKLREMVNAVQLRRWLSWSLMHPELGADRIHPSRSVFLPPYTAHV